jgi:hypothetical protein
MGVRFSVSRWGWNGIGDVWAELPASLAFLGRLIFAVVDKSQTAQRKIQFDPLGLSAVIAIAAGAPSTGG